MKTRHSMVLTALIAFATMTGLGISAVAAAPANAAKPAVSVGEKVTFAELEHHIGERIVIETTFNTNRSGVLKAWTSVSLEMELDPAAGSIDMMIPEDTVRSVHVMGAPVPALTTEGGSAKKN